MRWSIRIAYIMSAAYFFSRVSSLSLSVTSKLRIRHRNIVASISTVSHRETTTSLSMSDEDSTSSITFSMNPDSEEARLITKRLGISEDSHITLSRHADLVVEWNDRLNLISRKDCNRDVVFGRHILPSLALAAIPNFPSKAKIADIGTGGGFPGVPLAIIFPESEFLLVDSVGKKLKAIEEMTNELGLNNVKFHHGRAEEIVDDPINGRKHKNSFDICVGRSVSSMPKFCFWIQDLLKKKPQDEGKLCYIIGGEVEKMVTSRLNGEYELEDLLGFEGASDKRALIMNASDVIKIAKESGEKKQVHGKPQSKSISKMKTDPNDRSFVKSKGAWGSKDNLRPKQRGYESFKRYEY